MMQSGYVQLGRLRGAPVRMHVLTLLGAFVFCGFRVAPGGWLGFLLLVLLHEVGHALVVMRYGLRVAGIDLHAYGGVCHWTGDSSVEQRAVIAWGGVAAQVVVFAATAVVVTLAGPPSAPFTRDFVDILTRANLWLLVVNLLPFPPFDGADAWKVIGPLRERWRTGLAGRRAKRDVSYDSDPKPVARPKVSPEEARRIAKAFEDAVRKR